MSERRDDRPGMTPGDPLGRDEDEPEAPRRGRDRAGTSSRDPAGEGESPRRDRDRAGLWSQDPLSEDDPPSRDRAAASPRDPAAASPRDPAAASPDDPAAASPDDPAAASPRDRAGTSPRHRPETSSRDRVAVSPGDPLGEAQPPRRDRDRAGMSPRDPLEDEPDLDEDEDEDWVWRREPGATSRPERAQEAHGSLPSRRRSAERAGGSAATEPFPGYGPESPPPPGAGGSLGWSGASRPAATGPYVLSGWWRRAGAAIIDGIIVSIGGLAVLALFGAVFSVGFFAGDTAGAIAVFVGLLLAVIAVSIVALIYAPLMMSRTNGQTLGRMATGIRVVRANGGPMTFGFAMVREVAVKTLLFGIASSLTFGLASLLDVLWPLWDEENRALHDLIVDTRVVHA